MIKDLIYHFYNALISADFRYLLKTKDKGNSWKDMNLASLYRKMKKHNIQLGALIANGRLEDINKKSIDVILYSLMIAQRTSEMLGDGKKEV